MSFNLADYEPVADRLARFWKDHASGRVLTEMVSRADQVVTFRATVWFDKADADPTATGWASEVEGSRGVNATSALENCETSAIGRALANCNYAPKGQRPSREEMTKGPSAGQIRSDIARIGTGEKGMSVDDLAADFKDWSGGHPINTDDPELLREYLNHLLKPAVTA